MNSGETDKKHKWDASASGPAVAKDVVVGNTRRYLSTKVVAVRNLGLVEKCIENLNFFLGNIKEAIVVFRWRIRV